MVVTVRMVYRQDLDSELLLATAQMRALCMEAGGSDYARRVMRLLQTNLLSVNDIAPWYSCIARLCPPFCLVC